MLECTGLKKSFHNWFFRKRAVLSGLDFHAKDGMITGLIGRNGCGKTTTFRIIAGLLEPDAGEVFVDGRRIDPRSGTRCAKVSLQPENRGLQRHLTSRESIRQIGWLYGLYGAGLDRKVDELIDVLDMADIIDRRTKGFSRGEAAKVAMARTLIGDAQNLILDEPTNGLDVAASAVVRSTIKRLKDAGKCIVVSSHLYCDIDELCDEVALVRDGRIHSCGALSALASGEGFVDSEVYLSNFMRETHHAV